MGSFYSNITVRDRSQQQVLEALNAKGVAALVSPMVDGVTVIYPSFDDESDWQDPPAAAAMVSQWLGVPALAAMVYDSDILMLALAEHGEVVDEYDSCPGYFEDGEVELPSGMDAARLARLMGSPEGADAAAVEAILRKGSLRTAQEEGADVYTFEEERHVALVEALGHPPLAPYTDAQYILQDETPEGMRREEFTATEVFAPVAATVNVGSSLAIRIPFETQPASDDERTRFMTLTANVGREIMTQGQPAALEFDEDDEAFIVSFSGPSAETLRENALPALRGETWPAGTMITLTDAASGTTEHLEPPFA